MFQDCLKEVSRLNFGNVMFVFRMLIEYFIEFHGCFKDVSSMFQECVKEDRRVLRQCFNNIESKVSNVSQEYF